MCEHVYLLKFVVCNSQFYRSVTILAGIICEDIQSVFLLHFLWIGPGVVDIYFHAAGEEFVVDVGGAGVADIGAVPSELCCAIHGVNFFEGDARHKRFGCNWWLARFL
jgi:hypothetical protein